MREIRLKKDKKMSQISEVALYKWAVTSGRKDSCNARDLINKPLGVYFPKQDLSEVLRSALYVSCKCSI